MARENFSIGAFQNITKNQDNPIKTVGRDSLLSPKTPSFFRGHPAPGVAQPLYSRGHNQNQTYNICLSVTEIGSKTAEKNSVQTNKQTNKPTNRHYENNGHLAVNQLYLINYIYLYICVQMSTGQHHNDHSALQFSSHKYSVYSSHFWILEILHTERIQLGIFVISWVISTR